MPGEATVDRGDDYTPPNTDPKPDQDAADALAAQIEAEKAEKAAAEAAAKAAADAAKDGEGDADADAEGDKPAKSKSKDTRIPAARHKEILDRERERREAVEAELAKYKQGGQIAETNAEITEAENALLDLEKLYAKQLTDGEAEKAAETMAKIRKTERSINEKTAQMRESAAEARAVERVRYDVTVERLEAQYPELNIDHEDYDKAKTAEVMELASAYQLKGYTPSAALQKAVKYVMPPVTAAQERAVTTEARVDPKAVEAQRKAAAVEKTAEAVAKTPPALSKAGADSDKAGGGAISAKDVVKMSFKDFSSLDETTLARMRGDIL